MRTPTVLCLLLNLAAGPVPAQVPASPDVMRVDPATQRERDKARMTIMQDELVAEARELAAAQTDMRDAQASRAAFGKVQEIMERITLHRQNISALGREIALVERPVDTANRSTSLTGTPRSTEGRQPDDWLILGQPLRAAEQKPTSNALARRPLQSAEQEMGRLPEWIIPANYTGGNR